MDPKNATVTRGRESCETRVTWKGKKREVMHKRLERGRERATTRGGDRDRAAPICGVDDCLDMEMKGET